MDIRSAVVDDLSAMAALAEPLQRRPDRHIAYLSVDAPSITTEIADLTAWEAVSAVAHLDGELVGWLVGEIDAEIGRVWWLGPFATTADWSTVADALLSHAEAQLPGAITEQEFAVDGRFDDLVTWSETHGFHADPGSIAIALGGPVAGAAIDTRDAGPGDLDAVGALHDRLFPDTHTTGRQIVETTDPRHIRLVAEVDGAVVGYVALEEQADGSGYVDFVGVEESHRGAGIGGGLVAAGVAALRERGCGRIHLTVREANAAARALYARLGFVEEFTLVPLRKGFTLP
ncbi:MAG: GNAT family N-acetyltransferase [Acidimicrobiales bacterium]|nr:GNAT family N-acetyltransferase [Acidimicrobiales bacterium]